MIKSSFGVNLDLKLPSQVVSLSLAGVRDVAGKQDIVPDVGW